MLMEIKDIIEIIATIVGVLAAVKIYKIIECIINRKTVEKKGNAETEAIETDSLLKRYNTMEARMKELENKVDELYSMVYKLETEKLQLMKEKLEISMELKEAKYNECRRPDDECLKRLPQREICLAKKLLGGAYDKDETES